MRVCLCIMGCMGTISTLNTYLKRVDGITSGSNNFIFRGQADSTRKVECGASTRLRKSLNKRERDLEAPTFDSILDYHRDVLLERIKIKRIKGHKDLNNLEIIADLQHHTAATLLVDFTRNALVALYFACLSQEKNGAVFVVSTNNLHKPTKKEIEAFSENMEIVDRKKSNTTDICWWEPSHINNRIPAQDSVFVYGNSVIDSKHFTKIVIANKAKERILKQLDKIFNINEITLFNDIDGFATANSRTASINYSDTTEEMYYIINRIEEGCIDEPLLGKTIEYTNKYSNNHTGLFLLGLIYSELGNHEDAIEAYEKAIELKSDFSEAHHNLSVCYGKNGDTKEAEYHYSRGGITRQVVKPSELRKRRESNK
jgi:FRG domain/TPR repeat